MKNSILFLVVFLAGIMTASANGLHVNVTNKTGYDILHLYVSNVKSDDWEEDVLEEDILSNGQTVRVNLKGYKNPYFDIRAVDEDGDTYTLHNVNAKQYDVIFTLEDQD